MNFQDEMIKAIQTIVNEKLNTFSCSNEVATVVTAISKDKKYQVKINGQDYWVKDGVNINPTIGTSVWVRTPTPNLAQAYICAKR